MKATRIFRIFVSSTFTDLKEERNALQKHVFPKLRELCIKHGCRFQAIDLRWGVREEASLDQQTMKICFEEIKRCQNVTPRPNFIVLLGDRYGWRPLPPEIPAKEFKQIKQHIPKGEEQLLKEWYKRDDNSVPPVYYLRQRTGEYVDYNTWSKTEKRLHCALLRSLEAVKLHEQDRIKYIASATEQEILKGLDVSDASQHVFCFLRTIKGLPEDISVADFIDLDEEGNFDSYARKQLSELKKKLRHYLRGNVYEYKAKWLRDRITDNHLLKMCDDAYAALAQIILKEIERIEEANPLDEEIAAHQAFGDERSLFFVGRENALQGIYNYIKSPNLHHFAVLGPSGSGKSALMAQAIKHIRITHPTTEIIFRFIGATPDSSNRRTLIEGLCRQISRCYGDTSIIPTDFHELTQEFHRRLALAEAIKPLILFIDALDQLSNPDRDQNVSWLPSRLPSYVHVIISSISQEHKSALQKRLPIENQIELGPMSPREGRQLLRLWLRNAHRTLQINQQIEVLDRFKQCPLPLYLKLAFEEARLWRSDTEETKLSPDVPSIISSFLKRLSLKANHGKMMVSRSLGLIAAAKNGLTEDELLDVFSMDYELMEDFIRNVHHKPPEKRLPVVVWSRLYFDVKQYLTERAVHGTSLITFYHRQFGEVVSKEFLGDKDKKSRHEALSQYFIKQPLWIESKAEKTANLRKVSELPFQLFFGQCPELEAILCDLQFATAKCAGGMLFDLIRDCDQVIERNTLPSVVQMRKALLLTVPMLITRPMLAAQTLYNQLVWVDKLEPILQIKLDEVSLWLGGQGLWIRAEAAPPGINPGDIRYNPFGIKSGIQAISSDKEAVAVCSWDGKVEIRHSLNGELIETRNLNVKRIAGIALHDAFGSVACIDAQGMIRSEDHDSYLKGRKGENLLAYYTPDCILAARVDDSLVAWYPKLDESIVLKTDLPVPLAVLAVNQHHNNVVFVAGYQNQVIGVATNVGADWVTCTLPYYGPTIIDAEIDPEGKQVLVASIDRALKILNVDTGEVIDQLFYEQLPDLIIRGKPEKLTLGFDELSIHALLATRNGHVVYWNWREKEVAKLENYRTVSEETPLVLFDAISTQGHLFLSSADYAKIFTKHSLSNLTTKHESAVSGCVITASGEVVSISESDHTLRWFSFEKLKPLKHHFIQGPTAIAHREEVDEMAIGNQEGMVWNQKSTEKTDPHDIYMAFAEPITTLFYENEDCIIAAGKSGRVLRIHPFKDKVDVLRYSTGFETQQKILSADPYSVFWSLRQDQMSTGTYSVLSLVDDTGKEEVVFSTDKPINDVSVSGDGTTVCVASSFVKILRYLRNKWTTVYNRETSANHVAFLGNNKLIAVVLSEAPWIEVWSVTKDLPTVAAINVPSTVTCLATRESRIVAGSSSGALFSFSVRGHLKCNED